MSEFVIATEKFSKVFGDRIAVNSLDLAVPKGSIFGLLGTNGAGKTTTIRALMGHLYPTQGTVRVFGKDPWQLTEAERQRISYVGDPMDLPGWMTPAQAFANSAAFYPNWNPLRAQELLVEIQVSPRAPYPHLSKGQKRQLLMLLALCQNTDLLILDEPWSGLDVAARRFWLEALLAAAAEEERTVLLSSHLLSDLERIVDRVAILSKGYLLAQDELDSLKARVRNLHISAEVSFGVIREAFEVIRHEERDGIHDVTVLDFEPERFEEFCDRNGCREAALEHGMNLEDLFVELEKNREHLLMRQGKVRTYDA